MVSEGYQSRFILLMLEGYNKYPSIADEYHLCTVAEIMTGKDGMPGVCTLIDSYLDTENVAIETKEKLKALVHFIRQRATGEKQTGATRIRNYVRSHPAYKFDSVVTPEINYDLFQALKNLNHSDSLL